MNNSIVKLEDCQLHEISGGININKEKAKQVAKKTTGYAIKGLCTAIFGSVDSAAAIMIYDGKNEKFGIMFLFATLPLSGIAGWKIGELICKKIGLED